MRPIDADAFEADIRSMIDDSVRDGNVTANSMLTLMYIMLKKRPTVDLPRELPEHGDLIERDAALSHPFANGHYDHEHADEHFIFGHESYKEWLEYLPVVIPSNREADPE